MRRDELPTDDRAFRFLTPAVRARLAERGIDAERSFRGFMGRLLGVPPDHPRVSRLVRMKYEPSGSWRAPVPDSEVPRGVLTVRLVEILDLAAHDLTTDEVAEILGLSPSTVANHHHRIRDRLKVRSLAGAVGRGYRFGLLPTEAYGRDHDR